MKNSLFIKLSETPRSDVNDSNYKSKKIKIKKIESDKEYEEYCKNNPIKYKKDIK